MADLPRLAIFTICSNNYLPAARVLLRSARAHHPEADLFVCLVDRKLDADDLYDPDWTIIQADQLAIRDFNEMSFRYDILELNTAVKPFMFQHLLTELDYNAAIYFDPDIEIYRPLDSIIQPLAHGASFVVTPHLLSPEEAAEEPNDFTILRAGAYNLGFLAVGRSDESLRLLAWWARRVRFYCINAQDQGIYVDQKFFDLIPGFARQAYVAHDATLNVGYWNVSQRDLAGPDGGWRVDSKPLTFFHFSGFNPREPKRLSKHVPEAAAPVPAPLAGLLADYAEKLLEAGYGAIPADLYAYGRFVSGTAIHPLVRQMFRTWHEFWPDDPFVSYEAFLHEPWPGASRETPSYVITNFQKYLYDRLPYLHTRLDLANPAHVRELAEWYVVHAASEWRFDLQLIEPVAARIGRNRRARAAHGAPSLHSDVTVVGYLRAASGVGEVGRQTLHTLAAGGLNVEGLDVALGVVSARDDASVANLLVERGTAGVQIFNINADQIPPVLAHTRPMLRQDALRINIPFWELGRIPDIWIPSLASMDEIWAPSRFIQTALAARLDRPVLYMPVAVEIDAPAALPRKNFGLPEDRFLFFYAFDFLSFMERKNPRAAIAAFRRAFPVGGRAGLVLKCMNSAAAPEQFAAFQELIDGDPDIFLIDRTLNRADTLGLIAATDALISLHRSEGLGLLIAEAMLLGKPVIATDYSASREFVTAATGYPIGYQLIKLREGDYPFPEQQVWAEPDIAHAAWHMRRLAAEPHIAAEKRMRAHAHLDRNYSRSAVAQLQTRQLRRLLKR